MPFATIWLILEDIMPSKISQTEREILHGLTNKQNFKITKAKYRETRWKRSYQGWRSERSGEGEVAVEECRELAVPRTVLRHSTVQRKLANSGCLVFSQERGEGPDMLLDVTSHYCAYMYV